MQKKRILVHSNFCKMFTGFGKHKKNLLSYLYKTNKYEIFELSNGFVWSDPSIKYTPWESYGSLPDDIELHKEIAMDEKRKHAAGYGAEMIDEAIKELKPDIYLGVEDIWAFSSFYDKPWWNKINCIIHTTLDSLPILSDAVAAAPKIKNYFVWSSFAEKALHKLGHTHVKTIRGSLDTSQFYRLSDDLRQRLRKFFKLESNFIIGFVFRNQLRKSVPNLLDGFKLFDEANPNLNCKLLLHTHWSEGWDIPKLMREKNIPSSKVLTTYFCKNCKKYNVKPFAGQNVSCDHCKHQNSCETTNVKIGVTEQQLNEIYNLMDVYCHPFTSGGQEIPIQEAKLTELVTLVTNYSCGEDTCTEESGGLPLEWAEYREPGTQFIKASTYAKSIAEQLTKFINFSTQEKKRMGEKARQFVIDNFSIEVVGKQFEDLFDSFDKVSYEYKSEILECDPLYEPNNSLEDKEWIESLYLNILKKPDESGVTHWMQRLKTDLKRHDVLNYFRKIAFSNNQKNDLNKILEVLKNSENKKRIAYIEPSNCEQVLIASSILPSIKRQYPDHDIYFFTQSKFFDLINSNPHIHQVLPFVNKMSSPLFFEGSGNSNKYFDIVYAPYLSVNTSNFFHNGQDKIEYNINESH